MGAGHTWFMKVISVALWATKGEGNEAVLWCKYSDLADFNYFTRGKVEEFDTFVSRTVVERTPVGMRQAVQHDAYMAYCRVRPDGLGCTVLTDQEYDQRIAFGLAEKCLDDFLAQYPSEWKAQAAGAPGQSDVMPCAAVEENLAKFQNPVEADKITRMQKELDEVQEILAKSIDQVLQRGEKLDDLVEKSGELSDGAKAFYDTSKNQTGCCVVLDLMHVGALLRAG